MALPTFTSIALPQDMQIVDENGRISQAWYRVFQALIQLLPNTGTATTSLSASIAALDAELSALIESNTTRISSLEGNLDQPAIADLSVSVLPVGAAYLQAEVQALEARLRATNIAFNTLLASLEAANILEP
jgi:hypothetical protein